MKRLAAGALALVALTGVAACGPSDEEERECVQKYVLDNHIDFEDDLGPLNKELTKACGVNENYLRHKQS